MGTWIYDPQSKAELINKAFSSVFTHEDVSTMPTLTDTYYPDMPSIRINSEGILHLLLDLKSNKAPGPDKIPARLLKKLAYELAPVYILAVLYKNKVAYLLNGRMLINVVRRMIEHVH